MLIFLKPHWSPCWSSNMPGKSPTSWPFHFCFLCLAPSSHRYLPRICSHHLQVFSQISPSQKPLLTSQFKTVIPCGSYHLLPLLQFSPHQPLSSNILYILITCLSLQNVRFCLCSSLVYLQHLAHSKCSIFVNISIYVQYS